jgi:predicted phage terminase large subunit-like protein
MKVTKETILGLTSSVLSGRFDNASKTPEAHLEWWDLCCSNNPFVAIAAPRGHAKSTAITHCYTLACVLFEERFFVLVVSDTYNQAVMFLRDIKTELLENEQIQEFFGTFELEKETESDIIVRRETGSKFRIIDLGSEQKVRGLKWEGRRPDLIIGYDLENDEIVLNKDRREKFRNWMFGALLPCRSDYGVVRIVGTILHMDSFLENLMPPSTNRYTRETELKRFSVKPKPSWLAIKYRAHSPDFKQILWPGKWSEQRLKAERQKYLDIGNPEGYSQEYLNEPIDETRAYFRREDLLPMSDEDKKDDIRQKRYYAAVDFAITKDDRRDYTAIVVGGVDSDNVLHIVDVIRERMDGKEIIDAMFAVQERYSPDIFTVEAGAIEKALGPFLYSEMFKDDRQFINLNPLVPTKDKESRARSIQARLRAGGVRFNKGADWYPELERELRSFPRGVHDDQVDALAWLGLTLSDMQRHATSAEMKEEDDERELEEAGFFTEGRSEITGY